MTIKQKKKKVLIVEDNELNFTLLEKIFKIFDIEVVGAKDGIEAIYIFRNTTDIDLIFMDIFLPLLNGNEAAREIRKINPDIPIIAQSGYEEFDNIDFSVFDGVVRKPIDLLIVKNIVTNIFKMITRTKITKSLLKINAVKLNPSSPFTWASGIKSPIYCDNRKTLSYPDVRTDLKKAFIEIINEKYPDVELIAGVATGGIPLAALVADSLNLPFAYVRPDSKQHGLKNLIEGVVLENQKIVVLEDLISTGGSSLKAVEALKEKNCNVLGLLAIFSYGFESAKTNFANANCEFDTITNFNTLVNIALETNYINQSEMDLLMKWKQNPENWNNI